MKALLMHVAADNSNKGTVGISGPIFPDRRFEFIPIRDGPNSSEKRTYSTIPTKNKRFGKTLADFVPSDVKDKIVHYDPDFVNFTYADPLNSMRGNMLKKLESDDYIFFVASLAPFVKENYHKNIRRIISNSQKGKMVKYIIGYFEISKILSLEKSNNELRSLEPKNSFSKYYSQIKHNAHYKRVKDRFIIVIGKKDRKNALLSQAIPLTYPGAPFKPNTFAKNVYGDVSYPRGFKMIKEESKINHLLEKIK